MNKVISIIEQKSNPKTRYKFAPTLDEHKIFVQTQVIDEVTKRPTTKMVAKVNTNEKIKQFKISDFCVENLQISGAINNLQHIALERDNFSTLAALENAAQTIVNNNPSNTNE